VWHRRIGIVGGIFFVFLALSGVALNHADPLGLAKVKLRSSWLLAWYGMERKPELLGNPVAGKWVVWDGVRVYWRQKPLLELDAFLGAVAWQSGLAVADASALTLISADGEVVDRLDETELPGPIQAIGRVASGATVLRVGGSLWQADTDFAGLRAITAGQVQWVRPSGAVPQAQARAIKARWQPKGVSLERVLLDLHSGRFLGRFGVWFVDALALLLTALACTGMYLWWRRRK